jgi:hypothetical protein
MIEITPRLFSGDPTYTLVRTELPDEANAFTEGMRYGLTHELVSMDADIWDDPTARAQMEISVGDTIGTGCVGLVIQRRFHPCDRVLLDVDMTVIPMSVTVEPHWTSRSEWYKLFTGIGYGLLFTLVAAGAWTIVEAILDKFGG